MRKSITYSHTNYRAVDALIKLPAETAAELDALPPPPLLDRAFRGDPF